MLYDSGFFDIMLKVIEMDIFEKLCDEMINEIEKIILLSIDDHDEKILTYLEEKKKQVENCRSVSNDVGKYVDRLEKELK